MAPNYSQRLKEHHIAVENTSYDSLVNDVKVLLKQHARGKPSRITLSMETAALLESVTPGAGVKETSARKVSSPPDDSTAIAEEPPMASAKEKTEMSMDKTPSETAFVETLEAIAGEIAACCKCPLSGTRHNTVPGEGDPHAHLVFVGEAPGESEDKQGRPFVGRAGQLLSDIITKGMKLIREDVYICNVLKCRPPENRTPNPEEVMLCEPYLLRQLAVIQPKVICALGGVAAQTLLKTNAPIFRLRGQWHDYHGIPLRVTYHPAYLLRNPPDKAKAWEDVQEIMRFMKE